MLITVIKYNSKDELLSCPGHQTVVILMDQKRILENLYTLSFCSVVIGLFCLNKLCCWPYCWSNWINLNLINNQNLSSDNGCYGVCVCSVFDSAHHYWWMIINWDSLQLKCQPLLHWAALGMSRDSLRTDYGWVTKCWYRHWMLISINIFIMKD